MIKLTEEYLARMIKEMFKEASFSVNQSYPEPSTELPEDEEYEEVEEDDTSDPGGAFDGMMTHMSGGDFKKEEKEDDEEKKKLLFSKKLQKEEKVTDPKIIQSMRDIVAKSQHQKLKGVMVDTFTASLVVKIYDALGASKKKSFGSLPLPRMVDVAWKVAHKVK